MSSHVLSGALSGQNLSVKVTSGTKTTVEELSRTMNMPQAKVVGVAVEILKREQLLEAGNEAYARLAADKKRSKKFNKEFETWETAF